MHVLTWIIPTLILIGAATLQWRRDSDWRAKIQAQQLVLDSMHSEAEAFAALLDSRDTMVVILDRQGRVAKWNPAAVRFSGYTEDEMLGQTLERVMTPQGWAIHAPGFKRFMTDPKSKGRVLIVPCDLVGNDGVHTRMRVRVQAICEIDGDGFRNALALCDKASKVIEPSRPPEP